MRPLHRVCLIVVTLAACGREMVSLLADPVRLDYTENPGAFLSWKTAAFTVGAGLAAILLFALLAARSGFAQELRKSFTNAHH
jgi:hypothetical protein